MIDVDRFIQVTCWGNHYHVVLVCEAWPMTSIYPLIRLV